MTRCCWTKHTGLPTRVREQIFLEVGHFDPIPITLSASGTYNCLLFDLPRIGAEGEAGEPLAGRSMAINELSRETLEKTDYSF